MRKSIIDLSIKNYKSEKIAGLWCSKFGEDTKLIYDFNDLSYNAIKKDINYNKKFINELLKFFKVNLNKYHDLDWNQSNYEILIGLFIRKSIRLFYNRWNIVNTLISRKKKIRVMKANSFFLNSDRDLADLYNKKEFNNFIFNHIINFLIQKKKINNKNIIFKKNSFFNDSDLNLRSSIRIVIERIISKLYLNFSEIAVLNSYLPKKEEIELNIKLGSFPYIFINFHLDNHNLKNIKACQDTRYILFSKFEYKNLYEECYIELLKKIFPTCYLENFKSSYNRVKKNRSYPKVIALTGAHHLNVFFKIYLILAKKKNCKILSWQHGGHDYFRSIPSELPTSLKLISSKHFNWSKKSKKNPLGLFYISKFIKKKIGSTIKIKKL